MQESCWKTRLLEGDPLETHEALLGRSSGGMTSRSAPELVLVRNAAPEFGANPLARDPFAGATQAGSAGDSGTGSAQLVLNLNAPLMEELGHASESEFARGSPVMNRLLDPDTMSEGTLLMGMCYGMENRADLAPFFGKAH